MTINGEPYFLDERTMSVIAGYMNDDIRERLHTQLAPCEPEEFLRAYVALDTGFEDILESEFHIKL